MCKDANWNSDFLRFVIFICCLAKLDDFCGQLQPLFRLDVFFHELRICPWLVLHEAYRFLIFNDTCTDVHTALLAFKWSVLVVDNIEVCLRVYVHIL